MSNLLTRKDFYAHTFSHNPFLLRCITTYYRNYIYNIPESFFPAIHPKMHSFLQQKPYMALHEAFFLRQFGVNDSKNENFAPLPARIALLPKDYLAYIVCTIGMTFCQEAISTTVLKKDVQALHQIENILPLPEEIPFSPYAFALHKAANYQGHCQHIRQQIQTLTQEQTYGLALTKDFDSFDLDIRILLWGLWSVLSCTTQGGTALTLRTLLLLDAICAYAPPVQELKTTFCNIEGQSTQALAWPLLRVLLFKEIHCPWEEGWPVFFA